MSIMNYDRHGMENLKMDATKPFDRLKLPPAALYLLLFCIFAMFTYQNSNDKTIDTEHLIRKNMLLAMKKH
jgi:hypothetical protein